MKMFPLAPILPEFPTSFFRPPSNFWPYGQKAIVWFSISSNALWFGANAQVKESESKNLGGQIRRR